MGGADGGVWAGHMYIREGVRGAWVQTMGRGAQYEVCEVGLCLPNQRMERLAHLQGEVPQRCVLVVLALEVLQRDDDRPGCLADRDGRGCLSHRRPDELDHRIFPLGAV